MKEKYTLCLTIGNPDLDIPIVNEFKFSLNLNSKDFSRTCMLSLNLNISLNKKWGKKKHFSTKIEGYDLLNQTNGIRSSLKEDYYQITREATLGRYILLRCEYKF